MGKSKTTVIFEEKGEICLKYIHAPEYLSYSTKIIKKSTGKNPVTIELSFTGIPPCAAPMPPEEYKMSAVDITSLFGKVYSSHNGFRIKSEIKLSEYNCNQDLVSGKTESQIGFSISKWANKYGYKLH
ncbi:MAG: hypothetical protein MRK01_04715 [Candidatus Scalindua sp.]|nr:hypothetical protein [Candidatus Scalindua sp.]